MVTRRACAVPPGSGPADLPSLCRDCHLVADRLPPRCPRCSGGRLVHHRSLLGLTVAHIDCDAFYASVEKRDRPELRSRPVIVGGGTRGVVTAACYVARLYGVKSAMPMFKALRACPDAVVIKPDFAKYTAASRAVRTLMNELTPLVQPLSIDEAVLDLSGTEALHGAAPAIVLARFAAAVEQRVGVTVSVGLAANRLMAKIAAGRGKPRGFTVIDAEEAASFLAPESVRLLPGVGSAQARRLETFGITRLGQLQALPDRDALRQLGDDGPALVRRARGEDVRLVDPSREAKSISAETTFEHDLSALADLERPLWRLCEKLARRLKEHDLAALGVVLKLKTIRFASRTRAARLSSPTVLPDRLFDLARSLLIKEATGAAFRLIGIGANPLVAGSTADQGDLADVTTPRRAAAQAAIDGLRGRFGEAAIVRGRSLR
jgi:DNA polymerase IV